MKEEQPVSWIVTARRVDTGKAHRFHVQAHTMPEAALIAEELAANQFAKVEKIKRLR